jgi:hypothetical protein
LKRKDAPFDPTPLYAVTHTLDESGTSFLRVTAREGWYVDITAVMEAHNLMRIARKSDWVTDPKGWEFWHYQFEPPLPPGATELRFSEYLQLIGVHEYQLRNVGDGWPAHEDVDAIPR